MKNIVLYAVVAILGSVVAATAAQQTQGIVKDVNVSTGTLELQSGEKFTFKDGKLLYGLAPGDRVGVSHDGGEAIDAYNPHPAVRRDIDID